MLEMKRNSAMLKTTAVMKSKCGDDMPRPNEWHNTCENREHMRCLADVMAGLQKRQKKGNTTQQKTQKRRTRESDRSGTCMPVAQSIAPAKSSVARHSHSLTLGLFSLRTHNTHHGAHTGSRQDHKQC